MELPPPILISIASLLVILAVVFSAKGKKKMKNSLNCLNLIQFIAGICVSLIGAGIMFHGSVFGENNSGIATVIGIVGIALIATSSRCKN